MYIFSARVLCLLVERNVEIFPSTWTMFIFSSARTEIFASSLLRCIPSYIHPMICFNTDIIRFINILTGISLSVKPYRYVTAKTKTTSFQGFIPSESIKIVFTLFHFFVYSYHTCLQLFLANIQYWVKIPYVLLN